MERVLKDLVLAGSHLFKQYKLILKNSTIYNRLDKDGIDTERALRLLIDAASEIMKEYGFWKDSASCIYTDMVSLYVNNHELADEYFDLIIKLMTVEETDEIYAQLKELEKKIDPSILYGLRRSL